MPLDDLNLRPRKRVRVRFFENTAEAITFWACVTGLLFLALLYTFRYLALDKTTVPLEKVDEIRGELNREIDDLKLANGRLVLHLEAMQNQLQNMKSQLTDVGLQVDSLQLPANEVLGVADSIALDNNAVNTDSLGETWGIEPQQMKLPFEVEQIADSTASPEKRLPSESWAPKPEIEPTKIDSTLAPAVPAKPDSAESDSIPTTITPHDSISAADSLSNGLQ
ncbi:MAG: hypothetical protein AAFP70_18095 [Calditrichota bacterium]